MKICFGFIAFALLQISHSNVIRIVPVTSEHIFLNYYNNVISALLLEGYDYNCFIKNNGRAITSAFQRTVSFCVGDTKLVDKIWKLHTEEIVPCHANAKKIAEPGTAGIQKRMEAHIKCQDKAMKNFMDVVNDPELVRKVARCVPVVFDALLERSGLTKNFEEVKQCYQ